MYIEEEQYYRRTYARTHTLTYNSDFKAVCVDGKKFQQKEHILIIRYFISVENDQLIFKATSKRFEGQQNI